MVHGKKTLVMVEDEFHSRKQFGKLFNEAFPDSLDVHTFESPNAALTFAQQNRVDILISKLQNYSYYRVRK
jgi:DNA-binding NtrC family response regulator